MDILNKVFLLGLGVQETAEEKIKQTIDEMIKKGEMKAGEGKDLQGKIAEALKKRTEELNNLVKKCVDEASKRMHIHTENDIETLKKEIEDLKKEVEELKKHGL